MDRAMEPIRAAIGQVVCVILTLRGEPYAAPDLLMVGLAGTSTVHAQSNRCGRHGEFEWRSKK
jgi:hypothetical protein